MSTITLYGTPLSGHVHRVALLLRMLALPYEWVEASAAVRQSAAFRRLNPFGQIPVLQDGELTLADSNAILVYLVKRYAPDSHWLPEQPVAAAQVQAWLSKAAGEVRYGPASCRLIAQFAVPEDYQVARAISDRFLPQMEQHLSERTYLAGEQATIADLACYSYVAVAAEGGISLAPYPAIRRWVASIVALPGFFAMPPLPAPAVS
ncbi:glutathione S-transferase family protein [Serratia marcescens]|jgi:glutathione S-transferase|uniref:glutathione S-transferase family protein n=1 Tax=Serratia marcescens TaxID=615 RepID=UPI0007C98D1B|nr:glutathione S-transferase [Serratia marcescens]MDH2270497.1 glutathione S-transferase [Serratia marcescens]MDH2278473.1 glutathione S-transferase [Serratia marcescens]OAH27692.1 glutathione S-transferase [Serratia marcescens]